MKIGILTSGGDCPGLNAVIRAIVRRALGYGWESIGIENGWQEIIDEDYTPLDINTVAGIIDEGGTILGSSRYSPFENNGGKEKLLENIKKKQLDAIICIGGEGSMHVAKLAFDAGVNVVGVPKTIDNDIWGTDYTFGFDTASNTAMDAVDRIRTTAKSHHRNIVVEVMGRNTGWIAVRAGIAGGAEMVLIPEKETSMKTIIDMIDERTANGRLFSIIVVAEGWKFIKSDLKDLKYNPEEDVKLDDFGREKLGGISYYLAKEIGDRTGIDTRNVILSYIQRGGTPTAFDRVLGSRYGVQAVEMIKDGKFGRMAVLRRMEVKDIPIEKAISRIKKVDDKYYADTKVFFG